MSQSVWDIQQIWVCSRWKFIRGNEESVQTHENTTRIKSFGKGQQKTKFTLRFINHILNFPHHLKQWLHLMGAKNQRATEIVRRTEE
jgi:hypothetical protein